MKKLLQLLSFAAVLPAVAVAGNVTVANTPFRSFEVTAPARSGDGVMSRSSLGADDAIVTAPEGKVTRLSRSGKAYHQSFGTLYESDYSGIASEIVECDNGDVYLKNPVSMLATNLYIKGHREDKAIVFELPQVAYLEPYYGKIYPYKFTNCIYCESTDTYYPVNSEKAEQYDLPKIDDTFVVEIADDGSYRYVAPENGDILAGLVDIESDAWVGFGELLSVWEPFTASLVETPEGLETEDVAIYSDGDGYYAKAGYDGDDFYVQGLFAGMPSAWVKGKREGGKVVFASGQYVGVYPGYNAYVYFIGATYDSATNRLVYAESLTFDYDEETNALVANGDQVAVLSGEADNVAYIEYIFNPEIRSFPSDMSYVPAAPVKVDYDYNSKYHDLCVRFKLPVVSEEGLLLDKKNIYYSFYVDGELFTFTTAEYPTFKEDMSLFQYSFTDGREIMLIDGVHEAWFYFDEPKPVAIRSFYIKDGVVLGESDLCQTTGFEDAAIVSTKAVESIEYYNVSGQKIANPSKGLYIKVTKYSDGSRATEKRAVR